MKAQIFLGNTFLCNPRIKEEEITRKIIIASYLNQMIMKIQHTKICGMKLKTLRWEFRPSETTMRKAKRKLEHC